MTNKPPILHIVVVGFHHKLGCQVEFSYPPLITGTTGKHECPSGWKYLPTLALPDGSHNWKSDTIFFNLPSLMEPTESIYGVSCYRQISVDELKIRTADLTRSSVQKSVCVLTRLPIYGYIEVKLALIADAFFEQGDFSCTEILIKAYKQLNSCLMDEVEIRRQRHFYVGLNLREIVLHWRHKTLILFKLFLLQKRVICFGSPVRRMCALILGIASLMPRLLEKGFQEVACVRTSRPISPMPDFTDCIQRETEAIEKEKKQVQQVQETQIENVVDFIESAGDEYINHIKQKSNIQKDLNKTELEIDASCGDNSLETNNLNNAETETTNELKRLNSTESCNSAGAEETVKRFERSDSLTREIGSVDTLTSTLGVLSAINPDEYRAPVTIFASGNLCLPYLSLPYMDLLTDPSVLSYIIGTSNVLFQQKRQLSDVLIDIENGNIEIYDNDLKKNLMLTTEDLRFMDFVMKHVNMPKEDTGNEYWIREQFQGYILALLRTAVVNDTTTKENDHFNTNFMNALKRTQCFQEWYDVRPDAEFFAALPAGHPFAGTLSVTDMKLKIAQTMQNSESGRKINQAVNNTSRAVGGALSQAKGAFSNWWSSITTVPTTQLNSVTTNNDASSSVKSSSTSPTTQNHEISVTFQNSNDECNIEMGVSINIEEALTVQQISFQEQQKPTKSTNISRNTSSASSAGGSEKLLDSAEELEEDSINEINSNQNLITKDASDAEEATNIQQTKESSEITMQQQKGIVEIAKEAAVLDKNSHKQSTNEIVETAQNFDTNRDNLDDSSNNDGIFVV